MTRSTARQPEPAARSAACQVCGFIAVSGVKVHDAMFGRSTLDALKVRGGMNAHQLFKGGERRIVIDKIGVDPLGNQVIVDGCEALRTFRVMRTHVVQLAVTMGDDGSGRHLFSLCEAAHKTAHVELSLSSQSSGGFKH